MGERKILSIEWEKSPPGQVKGNMKTAGEPGNLLGSGRLEHRCLVLERGIKGKNLLQVSQVIDL